MATTPKQHYLAPSQVFDKMLEFRSVVSTAKSMQYLFECVSPDSPLFEQAKQLLEQIGIDSIPSKNQKVENRTASKPQVGNLSTETRISDVRLIQLSNQLLTEDMPTLTSRAREIWDESLYELEFGGLHLREPARSLIIHLLTKYGNYSVWEELCSSVA